jgi:hypothetical protein
VHPSLNAFADYRQFIIYRLVQRGEHKSDKLPVSYIDGKVRNAHDPEIWTDAATAEATAAHWGSEYGVGFVFTEHDPFFFLDIDNCLQADNTWSPLALQLCGALAGCAIEVSRSGRGLHLFGTGKPPAHGCTNKALGLEFYHAGRFVALSGLQAQGDAAYDASALLPGLVAKFFPPDADTSEMGWTSEPVEEWNGSTDDADLIRRAMQSRSTASAFAGKASFADLWTANAAVLGTNYPDPNGRAYDESAADAALAQHLAFWTGKNCERIRSLMLLSALKRDKWEREDYLPRTIRGAVGRQHEVLQDDTPAAPGASVEPPAEPAADGFVRPTAKAGWQGLQPIEQIEHFKGCIYIRESHRALIRGGTLLKSEQFKVHFGGHTFILDEANEKQTRDAWEGFTQNHCFVCPKVDGMCFRPDLAAGAIVERNGLSFVNTYMPIEVARLQGDASPFLKHLAIVLPDERDRTILLSYMAACVQHQGIKFQWAPLLQGVEGNGKTLFTRCVAEAVGKRYVHWPKASKLAKEFNAWMVGKVFYAVEDIYVPDSRREVIEELKPMITGGDGLEIEAKGIDQVSTDICGNFMFNSNHKDAIKKTANDRRFAVFFSAQQSVEDLSRDGLVGDYFPNLYQWLKADGYAIVSEYLHTFAIPAEYNPAGDCQRAPITSTSAQAIEASTGGVEQEIAECIAQGFQGFNGGFISSIWLDRMLQQMQLARKISYTKRKDMLEVMGYILHPALHDGRAHSSVLPEGGHPKLFVKKDSLLLQITDPDAVGKAYEKANINRSAVAAFGRK